MEVLSSGEMVLGGLCMLLVMKFSFSMLSFGSGAPGGIFLPLLVMGAVPGSIYYTLLSQVDGSVNGLLGNFIILGMTGFFTAIVRAPITGIILISEMTGSFSHLLTLSMVSLLAYLVPDILRCAPVYDQLLHRILAGRKNIGKMEISGQKVLIQGIVHHGSRAEGLRVSEISWPKTCLVISLERWDGEFVPRGDTRFTAGDKIILLCSESAQGQVHNVLKEEFETVKVVESW